jgi:hypothetical protein
MTPRGVDNYDLAITLGLKPAPLLTLGFLTVPKVFPFLRILFCTSSGDIEVTDRAVLEDTACSASEVPDVPRRRFEGPSESLMSGMVEEISESWERLRLRPLEEEDGARGSAIQWGTTSSGFERGLVSASSGSA